MATAEQHGSPVPDLYQRLGVPQGASGEEVSAARLAARGELAGRYLVGDRGRPW